MVAIAHRYHKTPLPKVRIRHRWILPDIIEMKFRIEVFEGLPLPYPHKRAPFNVYEEWQPVKLRYMINVLHLLSMQLDLEDVV